MKGKILTIIILFGVALLNYSCNEQISPNAPFRERYILNGIMRSDTSYQVVTISHSYQPEGLDPLEYKTDPVIGNADVNIYYNYKLYHMRDTVVVRTNTTRYPDSIHYYYNADLKPGPGQVIEIDALLPNGLLLQSLCETPDVPQFGFFDYESDKLVPPPLGTRMEVKWKDLGNVLYVPYLFINYFVKGDTLMHQSKMPVTYFSSGGELKPVFPTPTNNNFLNLDVNAIKEALNRIPENGKPKSDYTITNITLDLLIYDEYLSKYYSSIEQGLDGFTVKLDNPDYSNIKGGFGIFGSYIKATYTISFKGDFLQSVGF